jgi:hypothetical protein
MGEAPGWRMVQPRRPLDGALDAAIGAVFRRMGFQARPSLRVSIATLRQRAGGIGALPLGFACGLAGLKRPPYVAPRRPFTSALPRCGRSRAPPRRSVVRSTRCRPQVS